MKSETLAAPSWSTASFGRRGRHLADGAVGARRAPATSATARAAACSPALRRRDACTASSAPRFVTTLVAGGAADRLLTSLLVVGAWRTRELLRLLPDAPAGACATSSTARAAPVQPPIRSEIFGLQRFAQHGRSLGETHRAARARPRARRPSFRACATTSARCARRTATSARRRRTGYDISPAAEWLLDNFHLIEAQLKEIHDGLPRSYFRDAAGAAGRAAGRPAARLRRGLGLRRPHRRRVRRGPAGALPRAPTRRRASSTLGEMWALPTTLRVVLIENLRRLAERVATNKAAREVANLCCDRIETYQPATRSTSCSRCSNRRGVGRVFLAQMAQRLQDRRTTAADARYHDWLRTRAARPGGDAGAADRRPGGRQPEREQRGHLAARDRRCRLARHRRPHQRADAADAAARRCSPPSTTHTRDQTLHGIERLAQAQRPQRSARWRRRCSS